MIEAESTTCCSRNCLNYEFEEDYRDTQKTDTIGSWGRRRRTRHRYAEPDPGVPVSISYLVEFGNGDKFLFDK